MARSQKLRIESKTSVSVSLLSSDGAFGLAVQIDVEVLGVDIVVAQELLAKAHATCPYPQSLVLMVLWKTDGISVQEVSNRLTLNTNTVTSLLKRMEALGLITRLRSESDERKVIVSLTPKGFQMRVDAASIPENLAKSINADVLPIEALVDLRHKLNALIDTLLEKSKDE